MSMDVNISKSGKGGGNIAQHKHGATIFFRLLVTSVSFQFCTVIYVAASESWLVALLRRYMA